MNENQKYTKKSAGQLGGLATFARYGHAHFAQIGRRGAVVTWQRYALQPVGASDFAMVDRQSGVVRALLSGLPWNNKP